MLPTTRSAARAAAVTNEPSTSTNEPSIAVNDELPVSNVSAINIQTASSDEPTQKEAGLLGALRAACSLCGIMFSQQMTANDLLARLVEARDPAILQQPSESNSDDVFRRTGGTVCSSYLTPNHVFGGNPYTSDPFLSRLRSARRSPCILSSVRQDIPSGPPLDSFENSKLAAVNIGDVVVYREQGIQRLVMAAVIGIVAKRGRGGNNPVVKLQVQRLYQLQELVEIIDSIASYRKIPKLKIIKFCEQPPSSDDPDVLDAHDQYLDIRTQLKPFFRPPAEQAEKHTVLSTVMSDYVTYLLPEHIHKVIHATLNPAILERIDSRPGADDQWPTREDATKMLGGITVVWTSFLNTKSWTLHPIALSDENMVQQVLRTAGRALYWAPLEVTRGIAGVFRRYILAAFKRIGAHDMDRSQCVLTVPCPFNFFAHLIDTTRNPTGANIEGGVDLEVSWNQTQREWKARWARPDLLEVQLGHNWSCMQMGDESGRYIEVTGHVEIRYSHKFPDKVRFTMQKVCIGMPGGMSFDIEPDHEDGPAHDLVY